MLIDIEDEISLTGLIKTYTDHFKKIVILSILMTTLISVFLIFKPNTYSTYSSFFIPMPAAQSSALMGYAKLFGSSSGSVETYILSFCYSYRVKDEIAKNFSSQFKEYSNEKIIKYLKLSKNLKVSKNRDGLYTIRYFHTEQQLTYDVVQAFLNTLISFNELLDISADKNVITVLDPPRFPKYPVSKRLPFNLVLSLISSWLLIGLFWYIFKIIKKIN